MRRAHSPRSHVMYYWLRRCVIAVVVAVGFATTALHAADSKANTNDPDFIRVDRESEIVPAIGTCLGQNKEAVLFADHVQCTPYRAGTSHLTKEAPNAPFDVSLTRDCPAAPTQRQEAQQKTPKHHSTQDASPPTPSIKSSSTMRLRSARTEFEFLAPCFAKSSTSLDSTCRSPSFSTDRCSKRESKFAIFARRAIFPSMGASFSTSSELSVRISRDPCWRPKLHHGAGRH